MKEHVKKASVDYGGSNCANRRIRNRSFATAGHMQFVVLRDHTMAIVPRKAGGDDDALKATIHWRLKQTTQLHDTLSQTCGFR